MTVSVDYVAPKSHWPAIAGFWIQVPVNVFSEVGDLAKYFKAVITYAISAIAREL